MCCCVKCNQQFILENDFLSRMNLEHSEVGIDSSKFTKKALVKYSLGKVKVEENLDLELEKDVISEERTICKLCNTVVLREDYDRHHESHKIFICECGTKFSRKSHLENHELSVHSDARSFICEFCNKGFKTKPALTKHLKLHTHPRSEICHICGQTFNDKSVLGTHIKLKHFPTRDYQCSECGLRFPLKSTLLKHIGRIHNTDRRRTFSCSTCNMTYFDKSTLNRHMSVKHSIHPVKISCEHCSSTFSTKGNLYKHLRTSHKYDKAFSST